MDGCMCGCGWSGYGPRLAGWGYGPRFVGWPSRENRIQQLEEYQRDLEQQVADVAGEIQRLKSQPASGSSSY